MRGDEGVAEAREEDGAREAARSMDTSGCTTHHGSRMKEGEIKGASVERDRMSKGGGEKRVTSHTASKKGKEHDWNHCQAPGLRPLGITRFDAILGAVMQQSA